MPMPNDVRKVAVSFFTSSSVSLAGFRQSRPAHRAGSPGARKNRYARKKSIRVWSGCTIWIIRAAGSRVAGALVTGCR